MIFVKPPYYTRAEVTHLYTNELKSLEFGKADGGPKDVSSLGEGIADLRQRSGAESHPKK